MFMILQKIILTDQILSSIAPRLQWVKFEEMRSKKSRTSLLITDGGTEEHKPIDTETY